MTTPCFFGYGSLVNTATHSYTEPRPATLQGWRRIWRHATDRQIAYLSVHPVPEARIDGLLASVPRGDWAALDEREDGYDRHIIPEQTLSYQGPAPHAPHLYVASPGRYQDPQVDHPILLSYLDVVVQGFLQVFGPEGAERFFQTTDGWCKILDDRAEPLYPRAQRLEASQQAFVDKQLEQLSALVVHL